MQAMYSYFTYRILSECHGSAFKFEQLLAIFESFATQYFRRSSASLRALIIAIIAILLLSHLIL